MGIPLAVPTPSPPSMAPGDCSHFSQWPLAPPSPRGHASFETSYFGHSSSSSIFFVLLFCACPCPLSCLSSSSRSRFGPNPDVSVWNNLPADLQTQFFHHFFLCLDGVSHRHLPARPCQLLAVLCVSAPPERGSHIHPDHKWVQFQARERYLVTLKTTWTTTFMNDSLKMKFYCSFIHPQAIQDIGVFFFSRTIKQIFSWNHGSR